MITLLLGSDDFSKKLRIRELAQKTKAEVATLSSPDELADVRSLTEQNLFSKPKIFVLENLASKFDWDEHMDALAASTNYIFLVEEKLDKRLSATKVLLGNKRLVAETYQLPHGPALDAWIISRAETLGVSINRQAANALARQVGRDQAVETKVGGKVVDVKEVYNLWQVDGELRKLLAYARGREITAQDVQQLVSQTVEPEVLDIVNAIADKSTERTFNLVQEFLTGDPGADEKAKIIHLNALLAEQFRSVAIVQDFSSGQASDAEILQKTSWKSGRLFMVKKVATRFRPDKVLELLGKLEALDSELKTSSTPPKVLLDLILAQLLVS